MRFLETLFKFIARITKWILVIAGFFEAVNLFLARKKKLQELSKDSKLVAGNNPNNIAL